jgi:hypothetical protein
MPSSTRMKRSSQQHLGRLGLALLLAGCSDEECLWFGYTPPSARIQLRDSETGERVCDLTATTNRGPAVLYEDLCEYAIPLWYPSGDAGPGVTLTVTGYEPEPIQFPVTQDDCGQIEGPPLQEITLTPISEPGPPEGGAGGSGGTGGSAGAQADSGLRDSGTDAALDAASDADAATFDASAADASVDADGSTDGASDASDASDAAEGG